MSRRGGCAFDSRSGLPREINFQTEGLVTSSHVKMFEVLDRMSQNITFASIRVPLVSRRKWFSAYILIN